MAEGNKTFLGLAVPLLGESEIKQQTLGDDILTITGAASQTGDFLVCQDSAGTEKFVVTKDGAITKMGMSTIALASLASNASATVALSGLTTAEMVQIFARSKGTAPLPVVWMEDADKLGYGAPSVATAAMTVNIVKFATA